MSSLFSYLSRSNMMVGSKEVVLCVLLSTFKFELSEKPFVWNFAAISYPSASFVSSKPEMSLKVSLAPQ